jgi:hypothetical protein
LRSNVQLQEYKIFSVRSGVAASIWRHCSDFLQRSRKSSCFRRFKQRKKLPLEWRHPGLFLENPKTCHAVEPFFLFSFQFFFFFSFFFFKNRAHGRLDLTGLSLKTVPPEVYDLIVIISLTLDSNDLKDLDPQLSRLILLQELSCKCNKLEKLPEILFDLSALTVLDLSFNLLMSAPSGPFRQLKVSYKPGFVVFDLF